MDEPTREILTMMANRINWSDDPGQKERLDSLLIVDDDQPEPEPENLPKTATPADLAKRK